MALLMLLMVNIIFLDKPVNWNKNQIFIMLAV